MRTDGPTANAKDAPFVLVPQYFGSTVFDRSSSRYLPFDEEATALLIRLRSEPFGRVLAEQDDPAVGHQMTRFFEDFYRLGYFTLDGRFIGAVLDVQPPEDHLVGPLAVHLEVVAACNLRCQHCFAGNLPRNECELTIEELDDLFRALAGMGAFRLGLTGGEPLLRRDVFDIIDLATDHGLHPCLTSNGLLITEEIARELGKRTGLSLNVSLEGSTSETNDLVRGDGTFGRVLERLSVLSEYARFALAFTIMRSNLGEIEQCVELARRVGARAAVFRPLYPAGTARQRLDLIPTFEEYNEALNTLAAVQDGSQWELRALDPFNLQALPEAQAITHENGGCGAGNNVCSISVSGDVNPCSFLGPDFVAGNVRRQPFEDIWDRSPRFREIRALPAPRCSDDRQGGVYPGGCRARALFYSGSINGPDPWITDQLSQRESESDSNDGGRLVAHPSTILELTSRTG